jgi:putative DNA primase/helicase
VPKPNFDPKPEVRLTGDLSAETAATWAVMHRINEPPSLFQRGDTGVWVAVQNGQSLIRDLNATTLTRFATDRIRFVKKNKKDGWYSAVPTERLSRNMLASPVLPLPPLNGITRVPTYGRNGTLHIEPGYSLETGNLYVPFEGFFLPDPIPTHPTRTGIETALEIIDDLIGEFPFTTEASKAHAIAALLLPFVRPMIEGPTPLHLFSKPSQGTGGSLLAEVLAFPGCGEAKLMPFPNEEGERRRALSSVLSEMPGCVILDNVRELKSEALASCLTSAVFRDRQIGSSRMLELPNRCLWFATANSPDMSPEIARRVVAIPLDAQLEHPDQGREFKHDNLRVWVREVRVNLIWAALTLIAAWVAQGRPSGIKKSGSFESWSQIMGGILQVAGVQGFLDNLMEFRDDADIESEALRGFVERWAEVHGSGAVMAKALLLLAEDLDLGLGGDPVKRLGKLLTDNKNRRLGSWIITRSRLLRGKQGWQLRKVVD